jgi:hypothetical protein
VDPDELKEETKKERKLPIDFGGFGRALANLLKGGAAYSGRGPKKLRGRGYTKPFHKRKKKKLKESRNKKRKVLARHRGLNPSKPDKRHR